MPYVTKFNQDRIISDARINIDEDLSSQDIFEKPLPFLNKLELNRVNNYKLYCEGKIDINEIYKLREAKPIDRGRYVFEGKMPSYHSDMYCRFLLSNFTNIELPVEVQQWSEEDIEEYRRWFRKEIQDISDDVLIINKTEEEWGIKDSITRVEFKNSGSIYMEDLKVENILKRIDSLLKAQKDFYSQNRYYLARFSKATFLAFKTYPITENKTGLSDEKLKEKLRYYHNLFKEPVIYYLENYFKIKHSKEISFSENFLESLGFKKCSSCYNSAELLSEDNNKPTKLDKFLLNRSARSLCRKPSDLASFPSSIHEGYMEFYYFCKLMAKGEIVKIQSKPYRELIIEYIYQDIITYETAYYDEDSKINSDYLQIFNGYLVYTRFQNNNKSDFWRELFNFDYNERTNIF